MRFNNIQDLTHTFSPSFPVFPAFEPMKITKQYDVAEDGFYANRWDVGEHSGTHMDQVSSYRPAFLTLGRDFSRDYGILYWQLVRIEQSLTAK